MGLFILTDGNPNAEDDEKERFKNYLLSCVKKTQKGAQGKCSVRVQLMMCTDNTEDCEWLDDVEQLHKYIDAIDDYKTELQQVIAAKRRTQFTRGDWVMKAILGPVDEKHDLMDENGMQRAARKAKEHAALT